MLAKKISYLVAQIMKCMNKKFIYTVFALFVVFSMSVKAQEVGETKMKKPSTIKWDSNVEGSLLQFSTFETGNYTRLTIPRFTYFFNFGVEASPRKCKHLIPYMGLNLKNLGMITRADSVRTKYRIYTLGLPIGLRLRIGHQTYLKAGVDINWAFNYKEKTFINDKKKTKFNEFFSDRTPALFAGMFAGIEVNKMKITATCYPSNFFNQDFESKAGVKVYQNTKAQLFTIGLGYMLEDLNFNYKSKPKATGTSDTTAL